MKRETNLLSAEKEATFDLTSQVQMYVVPRISAWIFFPLARTHGLHLLFITVYDIVQRRQ